MIIKTLFSNYQETASEKTIAKKSLFVFTNQILRTTTSEKVASVHTFVKKNVIHCTFSLTNIIRVHYSIIQLHFKYKIRSSLRRSIPILHTSLSCAAAKQDAAIKQQHCRLRRYQGSANKQRHRY